MNPIKARNYGQVETCLAERVPFDHATISARWEHVWDGERDHKVYKVRSYCTVVAEYDPETGESWVSENYWGNTTGRHLYHARRNLPRVRSNDPSALDGIGPGSRVEWSFEGQRGRVIETHPLAKAVRVDFNGRWDAEPDLQVIPRSDLVLA
jgi:hypothetical protein